MLNTLHLQSHESFSFESPSVRTSESDLFTTQPNLPILLNGPEKGRLNP